MTWQHVVVILIAALMVVVCGITHTCAVSALPKIIDMATYLIVGVLGHAGIAAGAARKLKPKAKNSGSQAP